MNTAAMASHRSFQTLHPLSLLAQLTSRQVSGCLQVSNNAASWTFYLEQGKLTYATNSVDPFGRLDQHLRRLSNQAPGLVSAVRVQARLLFERSVDMDSICVPDYQAICWLINQQYLSSSQASLVIESLAKDVIESFLLVREGTYELIDADRIENFPQLCQLDVRALVEWCQSQLRQRKTSRPVTQPSRPFSKPLSQSLSPVTAPQSEATSDSQAQSLSHPLSPLTRSDSVEAPSSNYSPSEPRQGYPTPPPPGIEQARTRTYKIACIDDSTTVLNAINSFLDDKSFSVLMINNPVKALMQIVRSKPDLILLDVEMPNLDGYELCSLLRRHPSFKNTPIIMVTGNTGFIDRAKAKLVRASGYLTKPFTQSDLLKMIFKHLT
jgi:chemotaxis family two-component system response regulator PixG